MSNKLKKILSAVYILTLIFGFFYVRQVLSEGDLIAEYEEDSEKKQEAKVAIATVTVNGKTYEARMNNQDTVLDLLNKVRDEEGIHFERIDYIDGPEIVDVNHTTAPEGSAWRVFYNNTDITKEIPDQLIIDNDAFEIKLTRIEEQQ